jgi:hypothetical protein
MLGRSTLAEIYLRFYLIRPLNQLIFDQITSETRDTRRFLRAVTLPLQIWKDRLPRVGYYEYPGYDPAGAQH